MPRSALPPRSLARLALVATAAACALAPAPAAARSPEGGSVISARPHTLLGRTVHFRGTVADIPVGRSVEVQRQLRDGSWERTARARVGADGTFLARWRSDSIGRFVVRAVRPGTSGAATPPNQSRAADAATAAPTTELTVYRPVRASFFGPGLYGNTTACGQVMTPELHGVAHRTLPCGTLVDVVREGRAVTVPVVDRGPFVAGVTYDLTAATAALIGLEQTEGIGAVRVRKGRPAANPALATAGDPATGGASAR